MMYTFFKHTDEQKHMQYMYALLIFSIHRFDI